MTDELFFMIAIPAHWYKLINSIEISGVSISSPSGSANQSNQLQSPDSQDEATIIATNKTHTSSLVEKLLQRSINNSEINFESQGDGRMNSKEK